MAYCQGQGIDIGVGRHGAPMADPVTPHADTWDIDNGDATYMLGVPDHEYDWVYSSHCLEHLANPLLALKNWWRILRPTGHLILYVPHRDLYEKRVHLPSDWNHEHKFFILPDRDEMPHTLGLAQLIAGALVGQPHEVLKLAACDEHYVSNGQGNHAGGEYSIEAVVRKLAG